jgi:hypothetical protein
MLPVLKTLRIIGPYNGHVSSTIEPKNVPYHGKMARVAEFRVFLNRNRHMKTGKKLGC